MGKQYISNLGIVYHDVIFEDEKIVKPGRIRTWDLNYKQRANTIARSIKRNYEQAKRHAIPQVFLRFLQRKLNKPYIDMKRLVGLEPLKTIKVGDKDVSVSLISLNDLLNIENYGEEWDKIFYYIKSIKRPDSVHNIYPDIKDPSLDATTHGYALTRPVYIYHVRSMLEDIKKYALAAGHAENVHLKDDEKLKARQISDFMKSAAKYMVGEVRYNICNKLESGLRAIIIDYLFNGNTEIDEQIVKEFLMSMEIKYQDGDLAKYAYSINHRRQEAADRSVAAARAKVANAIDNKFGLNELHDALLDIEQEHGINAAISTMSRKLSMSRAKLIDMLHDVFVNVKGGKIHLISNDPDELTIAKLATARKAMIKSYSTGKLRTDKKTTLHVGLEIVPGNKPLESKKEAFLKCVEISGKPKLMDPKIRPIVDKAFDGTIDANHPRQQNINKCKEMYTKGSFNAEVETYIETIKNKKFQDNRIYGDPTLNKYTQYVRQEKGEEEVSGIMVVDRTVAVIGIFEKDQYVCIDTHDGKFILATAEYWRNNGINIVSGDLVDIMEAVEVQPSEQIACKFRKSNYLMSDDEMKFSLSYVVLHEWVDTWNAVVKKTVEEINNVANASIHIPLIAAQGAPSTSTTPMPGEFTGESE